MGSLTGPILVISLTILWAGTFLYTGIHINNHEGMAGLFLLGAISLVGLIHWILLFYRERRWQDHLHFLDMGLGAFASSVEMVILDNEEKIVWSTHNNAYPNLQEFIRRILSRVSDPQQAEKIQNMIENRLRGEVLFPSGGNGLGQDQKWYLFTLAPFDKRSFMASIRDITLHFEAYHQLKVSHQQLQQFVETAPFGIFYSSRQGTILGVNNTLCQWLELSRDDIIGRPVMDFIKDADTYKGVVRVFNKNGPTFKAILFKPEENSASQSRTRPTILCRLDKVSGLSEDGLFGDTAYLDAAVPAVMINQYGEVTSSNTAFSAMLGDLLGHGKARGKFSDLVSSSHQAEIDGKIKKLFELKAAVSPFDVRFEGDRLQSTVYPSRPHSRAEQKEIMLQFIDISEQKRLEGQFIQSQKMQAVGQLAGGIAHDFNNLLTAMIGYCDLLLQRYLPNDPSYNDVVQIKQNANRAANLVRQLLAFSRQQTLQPKVVNITDHLVELSTLLRRLIGAGIELKMSHARDLWYIKVDVSQLEQVIINLAVNARDAMKEGGVLTIRTSNVQYKEPRRVGHDVIAKGDYVAIDVIDTGTGIPPEHLDYIFEPFFSTKEVGAGTGLGLSTVYGIVKQTGGFVLVDSKLGKGSNFTMLFPRYLGTPEIEVQKPELPTQDLTGGGRILLVEDEDAVRMFSARALREKGYTVIEAPSGDVALGMVQNGEKFDLLVTDVVMPRMDGPTLSKKIRDRYPDAKTIFISGYTEDTFRKNLDHDAKIHFLPKPYTIKDLAAKIKEVLTLGNNGIN